MPSAAFTPTTPDDRLPAERIFPPADPSLLAPIWQWPPGWQCPMLAMSLSLGEQRRVFKQPQKTRHLGAYDLHQALMAAVGGENTVSRRIDRLLRRRFQRTVAATASLSTDGFMARWRCDWLGSEGPGLFFVAAARCDLDENMRREIYGCVHMAGHLAAVDLLAARRDAARQRQANARLARTVRKLQDQDRRREEQYRNRIKALATVRRDIPVPGGAAGAEPPTCRLSMPAQAAGDRLQAEVRRLEREKRQLEIRYFELQAQNQQLAQEVRGLIGQMAAVIQCRGDCHPESPPGQICPRRVLIVGGMTKLQHLYRELIEAAGGELDYCDGYLRQANDNLQARIGRSDMVICPANCNSHNACKRVKGICKRLNKRLHILPSASLSAITAALQGDATICIEPNPVSRETAT
jgi:hypothetical protein